MSVSFRIAGPATTSRNASTVAYTVPSGASVGDLLVATYAANTPTGSSRAAVFPAGWSILDSSQPDAFKTYAVAYKVATSGDIGGTFTVNASTTASDAVTVVLAYAGVSSSDGIAAHSFSADTTSPAVTVDRSGFVLDLLFGSSGQYGSAPSGDTTRGNFSDSDGINVISAADRPVTSGTLASRSWTGISSSTYRGFALALRQVNTAPSAPGAFTSPTAGQTVNASVTATWGAATDAEGDALTYGLDFSRDNGATWTRVYTGSATTYSYNTSGVTSSTACLFRVYANDGTVQGPTTTSPVFTIQHNQSPTAPTGLSPDGNPSIDRTAAQTFTYVFNDPDAGDTQSKRDIQYRITGTSTWTTVTDSTTSTSKTWAANTFAAGAYEWQVRTYDSQGAASPWSASAFFTASTPPAGPSITSPANGATIATQSGVIAWSYATQQAYEVRKLADNAGSPADPSVPANVYYDTGVVTSSTARNAALTFPVTSRYEHLQVRVQDSGTGLWSPYSSVRVLVSYTPPASPTLVATPSTLTGTVTVAITNPTPTGTQPTVTSVDLYRRPTASSTSLGTRIAAGLAPGTPYADATVQAGVDHQYLARAFGSTGATADSAWTA